MDSSLVRQAGSETVFSAEQMIILNKLMVEVEMKLIAPITELVFSRMKTGPAMLAPLMPLKIKQTYFITKKLNLSFETYFITLS